MPVHEDKALSCRDCGARFTWTAGEQEFFDSKGFTNPPTRCPSCRAARKAERGGYSSGGGGYSVGERTGYEGSRDYSAGEGRGPRRPLQMYPAVCAQR
jgi:hypothetical protein